VGGAACGGALLAVAVALAKGGGQEDQEGAMRLQRAVTGRDERLSGWRLGSLDLADVLRRVARQVAERFEGEVLR
jgi:hypothetical protein